MNIVENANTGLSSSRAGDLLEQYGKNIITHKNVRFYHILLKQFKSPLIYLLIAASVFSFLLRNISDGITITAILLINAILGFIQEYRSEKIVEKLSKLISREARVRRDGQIVVIPEEYVVPGDIVIVKEGDIVPADITITKSFNLSLDESSFSGESFPKNKNVNDKAFSGTIVEKGEAEGEVYATGNNTEIGKIAVIATETHKHTQYEKSLASFSSFLIKVTLFVLFLVFILKLITSQGNLDFVLFFLFIIALAIAVVPEALPVITTLTLSRGALNLARRHVVVKRLPSLEDLGNINILCTDKTGTLTENKLNIVKIEAANNDNFLVLALACANSDKKKHKYIDAFDEAFSEYSSSGLKKLAKNYTQIEEIPFDPNAKRRRLLLKDNNGKYILVSMGAPEAIFEISNHNVDQEMGGIIEDSKKGLRHIAIAYKEVEYYENFNILDNENNLNFVGYSVFEDPLKPSAKHTIALAEKLGVVIKIITGDSKEVSEYVASEIGLISEGQKVYSGSELDQLSKEEFKKAVVESNVFARVTPEQKSNIIEALKEDNIVGYQGDGINDALALKTADVAIAVNTATDVAKDTADIILLKKDLEVIVNGIKGGRMIFVNVNKYIKYTMVGNFGNFFALSAVYLMSANVPLLPVQLLLTNLIGDLPLVTISTDNVDKELLLRPKKSNTTSLILISVILGSITSFFEFIFFSLIGLNATTKTQTSLFLYLTIIGFVVIFSVRSDKHFWKQSKPSFLLVFSIISTILITLLIPYLPIATIFSFTVLPFSSILEILVLSSMYFVTLDLVKVWYYSVRIQGE